MQYVSRGVFYLTDAFVRDALARPQLTPSLRLFLLSRMRDTAAMMAALREEPAPAASPVHHYAQQLGVQLPTAHQIELLEGQDDSFFLPLTVFRDHVKKRDGTDGAELVDFVYRFAHDCIHRELSSVAGSAPPP